MPSDDRSRLLLDTHAFVWWAVGSRRIPVTVVEMIAAADDVVVSDVSLWEIVIEESTRHPMIGTPDAIAWFTAAMSRTDFGALGIGQRHIGGVQSLPSHHRDPFDRLLISQSIVERRTIVTGDADYRAYPIAVAWG